MNATGLMDIGLYVASRVAVIPVEEILKGMIPFFIPFILSLIVIVIFPDPSTWLPNLVIEQMR